MFKEQKINLFNKILVFVFLLLIFVFSTILTIKIFIPLVGTVLRSIIENNYSIFLNLDINFPKINNFLLNLFNKYDYLFIFLNWIFIFIPICMISSLYFLFLINFFKSNFYKLLLYWLISWVLMSFSYSTIEFIILIILSLKDFFINKFNTFTGMNIILILPICLILIIFIGMLFLFSISGSILFMFSKPFELKNIKYKFYNKLDNDKEQEENININDNNHFNIELEKAFYTLNIDKNSSDKNIKLVYYKLAKKYHPDVSKEQNAEIKFKKINEAYEIIKKYREHAQ